MSHRMNPRWTRFLLLALMLVMGLGTSSPALAGNTHSEGGAVVESPGVPETDGTATVQIYWTGDSAARVSTNVGSALAGYWLGDVGFTLARPWLVGDEHVAYLEFQTGAGTAAHAGYYGITSKTQTSLDPDEFPSLTARAIPAPVAAAGPGYVDLVWNQANGGSTPANIAGYNVYRSGDGVAFTKLNATVIADSMYRDPTVVFGQTYQYALSLVYRGTPQHAGTATSANSNAVTPLDTTPPDVPVLAGELPFTRGTTNALAWSNQAASGATSYYVECALDDAFGSLVGNSGWMADTTFTFTGLADGRTYHYHVRARDAAGNASAFSARATSRQDASSPQSHLLASTGYKSSSTVGLEWAASDSVSGIANVQLYYSKDGGPYTLYPGGPFTSSPIAFDATTAGGDGSYAFYTLATDEVANAESAPESPDATLIIDTQAPAAPTLAAIPVFSPGLSRALAWTSAAPSGAVAYRAQASASADFASIAFQSSWQADSAYAFTGLADGQSYFYRVQSRDLAGNESAFASAVASTQDASAPATEVAAQAPLMNTQALSIAWSGSDTASGLTGVELFWSKDGGAWTQLAGGPFTSSPIAFDATTASGDGSYGFYTRGTDAVGNVEAAPSSQDAGTLVDTQAPALPSIASLPTFTAGDALALAWSDQSASGATAYRAQASTDAGFATIAAESGWVSNLNHTFTGLADAQRYYYRVEARDAAGNETTFSEFQSSTQDATAPMTQVAALPAMGSSSTLDIAWTGSDATSGMAGVDLYYAKDGAAPSLYTGSPFVSSPIAFDATTLGGDGSYTLFTRGHDTVGNVEAAPASADAQTSIDTSAPGAPSIAGLQSFAPGSALTLHWSDESASGAAEYLAEMSLDAGFASPAASTGWMAALTHEFTGLADGQHYFFRIKARDAAHNETGWSGMQSATMDATPPQSAVAQLPALSGAHVAIAYTANDATSGVQNVDLYYYKDGAAPSLYTGSPFASSPIAFDATILGGDGHYSFYSRARDAVGNLEDAPSSGDAEVTVDTAAPQAPAIAALPAWSAGASRALAWSDQSASGATAYRTQKATDAAFTTNLETSDWIAATSHSFEALADGQTYYYRVQSRDAAGNESGFGAMEHSAQDATAPATQVAALAGYSASAALALTWTGSDAGSGIHDVDLYYSKDGGAATLYPGSPFASSPIAFDATTSGGDGEYQFYIRARDGVGNLEDAPASADAHTHVDTHAPDAPAIASLPTFLPGNSAAPQWSDQSASGAIEYRAQAATQASFASLTGDSGWIAATTFTFTGLADGQIYHYRVQARDAAQNATAFSAALSATQDATAPASSVASLPSVTSNSELNLSWNASDMTSGVQNVDLYYSKDGAAPSLYTGSPFASSPIAFDATILGGDGHYNFFTRARDQVGNVEAAPSTADAQITVDTAAPATPALTSLPAFARGSSITVAWSNQSASGATEYLAEMSTSASFATLEAQTGWIPGTSYNFNGMDDGVMYHFRVKARDAVQNMSPYATTQTVTMDDTSPASQVAAIPTVTTTASLDLAWTANDATSGIAGVDLYYAREGGAYTPFPGGPFAASPIHFDTATTGGEGNYAFYTRARDAVGNRETAPASPDAQTTVNTHAVQPPTLAALPSFTAGTSRTVTWAPSTGSSQYLAQVSEDANFGTILAASVWIGGPSYTFDGLSDGHRYYYRLKGRSSLGIESFWSTVLSSTQDATAPASQVAPLAAAGTDPHLGIVWGAGDATSGVAGVELYFSRNGGAFAAYSGGPFTSSPIAFDVTALGGDGDYAFYTRATDNAGNVESSPASADAHTLVDTQAPAAPELLAEPGTTFGTENTLVWNARADASEYYVQCAGDPGFLGVVGTSSWMPGTSYTFTGLELGTTYYYRVRARDAVQNTSPWSSAVSSTQAAGYVLSAGWNLISFATRPDDQRIDHALASILGSYSIVRSYDSASFRTYLPSLPLDMNDLTQVDGLHGYWIYMTKSDTLTVAGMPIAATTPIDLPVGWQLVSYLPPAAMAPSQALGSIDGSLALARGYDPVDHWRTFYPTLPALSDLSQMRPGRGYWLYMTAADQLIYGGFGAEASIESPVKTPRRGAALRAPKPGGAAVPTVMDVWSTDLTLDGKPAPAGTAVDAYDASGTLCGSYTLVRDGVMGVMHLTGDISSTEADEGVQPGEALTFKLRGQDATLVRPASINWQADDARQLKMEFSSAEALLPKAFDLSQNLPNPFNPTTAIAYAIPSKADGRAIASTHVELRIFDIRGRNVRTLVDSNQKPGRYTARWDGRNDRGETLGSGVYFYRLRTEQFSRSRRMILVK